MNQKFLKILKCLGCSDSLTQQNGRLFCKKCKKEYFLLKNVPILLTSFKEENFQKTRKSFSNEWNMFRGGDKTWTWDIEERKKLFLQELNLKNFKQLKEKLILDAGCGNGQLTTALSEYCKIIGMDQSSSVFGAEKRVGGENDNLLFVQGNIMQPPFKQKSFDIIYSSGVLHHTPNTFEAFKSLIPLLKQHGKYYVYLYRKDRKDETLITYIVYRSREITKKLPLPVVDCLCTMLAPFAKAYADTTTILGIRNSVKRSIGEHKLSLYDHLSPRFAYRHTIPEVSSWFKRFGFKAEVTFQDRNGFGILGVR